MYIGFDWCLHNYASDAGKLYVKILMTAERVIFGVANYEILLSVCITILDTVTWSAVWLDCRFHIIRLCLHSMFPTAKTDLCWVVLYWQSQNSTETLCQPFWMVWADSCFWSVAKTISLQCHMRIVKVSAVFSVFLMQLIIYFDYGLVFQSAYVHSNGRLPAEPALANFLSVSFSCGSLKS